MLHSIDSVELCLLGREGKSPDALDLETRNDANEEDRADCSGTGAKLVCPKGLAAADRLLNMLGAGYIGGGGASVGAAGTASAPRSIAKALIDTALRSRALVLEDGGQSKAGAPKAFAHVERSKSVLPDCLKLYLSSLCSFFACRARRPCSGLGDFDNSSLCLGCLVTPPMMRRFILELAGVEERADI
mmetsp:Transcript_27107/g.47048  ORF Transcript_27107/g.47048 Transcript_27107/m.47048 type:complete len:188 (-) Transcript_27107:701-1264(-)